MKIHRAAGAILIAAAICLPVTLLSYSSNPPSGLSGAPGEGTCGGCHSPVTVGSGVTIALPASATTYTPGGAAIPITVTLGHGSGGFELSARVQSNNSQAGTLAAGAGSSLATASSIQYVQQTSAGTSWTFNWTPPATNVGTVELYVAAVSGGQTYTNNLSLTASGGTTTPETIAVSNSSLTFAYSGTAPPAQTVQVTSSGASIPFTTSVATTSGGNWLTATPTGGNTPMGVAVSASAAGLAVGTYMGSVTIASTGATDSPLTVNVTFDVTSAPPPAAPTLAASPKALTFTAADATSTVAPQTVQISMSDNSKLAITAKATTTSGGAWLSVAPTAGTTPQSLTVTVTPTGLASGKYSGTVTVAASGASNSPLSIPISLTVGTVTPPPTDLRSFSFHVLDKLTGGTDEMLLDGSGTADSSGMLTGGGTFTRFIPSTTGGSCSDGSGSGSHQIVSSGTWKVTSVQSYTPGSRLGGGVLLLNVTLMPSGGTALTGTMQLSNTGTDSGVKLVLSSGDTFMPTGAGYVTIIAGTGSVRDDAVRGGAGH